MKKLTSTLVFAVLLSTSSFLFGQEVWTSGETNLIPSNHWVNSLKIAPDSSVWAISETKDNNENTLPTYLFRSIDLGKTWIRTDLPETVRSYDISPINSDTAYLALQSGLFKTIDGGKTWDLLESDSLSPLIIHFFNENDGFGVFWDPADLVAPYDDYYFITSDGGSSWTKMGGPDWEQPVGTSLPEKIQGEFTEISWMVSSSYDVVGDTIAFSQSTGHLWLSTDKGYHWERIETPLNTENCLITSVAVKNSKTILVGGNRNRNYSGIPPLLYFTLDGGASWQSGNAPLSPTSLEHLPGTESIFIMGGHNSHGGYGKKGTAVSLDYGSSWHTIDNSTSISGMEFIGDSIGISCYDNDVAKGQFNSWNLNAQEIQMVNGVPELPLQNQLRIYPNPVKDQLQVDLNGEFQKHELLLEIISLDGKVILARQNNEPGSFSIPTHRLTTGLYLLKLTASDKVVIQRFIKE